MTPIGQIRSCYPQKFGVPRQSGLVPAARAIIELAPEFAPPESLRGLEEYSHLWVIFLFDQVADWRPTVRPPRLGGNRRTGVYATRSPFRPNPIGLSAVALDRVEPGPPARIHVRGGDFLDGTPVLDIKPYLPWTDAPEAARGGLGGEAPRSRLEVRFSPQAERQLQSLDPELRSLISQVLAQDPRPAYQAGEKRSYGMRLECYDIRWRSEGDVAVVEAIEAIAEA